MSYDINSDITQSSGLNAAQLEALISNTGLAGLGQAFYNAEQTYHINALFMIAHAAIESAWGKSYYAVNRNNLFGFNAVDSDTNQASFYPTKAASIDYYANFLRKYYLTPGAVYYNGTTPHDIFIKYSSSHDAEANSVVGIMNSLAGEHTTTTPTPVPKPAAPANVYIVIRGDNLSTIAQAHGLSLAQLLSFNPQFQSNPNLIYPGQVVHLGGAVSVTPPKSYTVKSGDNLYNIAIQHGETLGQLEAKNPQIHNPNLIYPGQVINV